MHLRFMHTPERPPPRSYQPTTKTSTTRQLQTPRTCLLRSKEDRSVFKLPSSHRPEAGHSITSSNRHASDDAPHSSDESYSPSSETSSHSDAYPHQTASNES